MCKIKLKCIELACTNKLEALKLHVAALDGAQAYKVSLLCCMNAIVHKPFCLLAKLLRQLQLACFADWRGQCSAVEHSLDVSKSN